MSPEPVSPEPVSPASMNSENASPGRAAARKTLILVHAAGRAGRSWKGSVGPLSEHWNVLTPDLPGFGPAGGRFTFDAAVETLATLARESAAPVHVAGLSMGAMVAAQFAAEHPELVDRLVLCAIALHPAVTEPRTIRFYRRVPVGLMKLIMDIPDRSGWLAMCDAVATVDLTPRLPRITARTLVLCGGRDRRNLADSRIAAALIPNATLYVIPHVGHTWPVTRPRLFQTVLTGGFLDLTADSADSADDPTGSDGTI